jgi:CrcB protein
MMLWIGVALLGGLGAVARFVLDDVVSRRAGRRFPWGILVVNVTGAFALGVLSEVLHGDALLLAGTALLGAYTTFSTWMVDTAELRGAAAVANVVGSLALGLGAVALAQLLAS